MLTKIAMALALGWGELRGDFYFLFCTLSWVKTLVMRTLFLCTRLKTYMPLKPLGQALARQLGWVQSPVRAQTGSSP